MLASCVRSPLAVRCLLSVAVESTRTQMEGDDGRAAAEQESVLRKQCDGLNSGGVLIFTMGGTDQPGEVQDAHMGVPMYTATMGIAKMLVLLTEYGCVCRHLEYDQYPQLHVYIIAQKA
jgi:hypothetical protein